MAAMPIPPGQHERPETDRLPLRHIVRGCCWLSLVLLLSFTAILLLDTALELPLAYRCLLQLLWLVAGGVFAWRLLVQPLGRGFDRSPVLQMVVTSSVWLSALAAASLVPGSAERIQRIAMPWYRSATVVPYHLVVASGDATVRRGDAVTLSGYAEPVSRGTALPDSAVIVIRDPASGGEQRLPMTGTRTGAFHATRADVGADFEYRIEAGGAASSWYSVRVADPVEIAPGTTITITPPTYAASDVPAKTQTDTSVLEGIQYSTASLRLRFTHPAASAFLEWRPEGRVRGFDPIPVELSADRCEGAATLAMVESGTLVAVLVGGTGAIQLRTETPMAVRVRRDEPPRLAGVSGIISQPRIARPGEALSVAVSASDDVGLSGGVLEYSTSGDGTNPVFSLPIHFTTSAARRAEGRVTLDLAGKGREGETLHVRVRVWDIRRIEREKLGPQEAVYPPSGWEQLTFSESAEPLERQEILGRKGAIRTTLLAAHGKIRQAQADARALREEGVGRSPLPIDHAIRLKAIRELCREAIASLLDAARDADLAPRLRPFVAALREVVDRPLLEALDALARASTDDPAARDEQMVLAIAQFGNGIDRIEDLIGRNDKTAQDLLDRRGLELLASDQEMLTAQAARPAAGNEELLRLQMGLLTRLGRIVAESNALLRGMQAAASREALALAAETDALAALVQELDAAADRLTTDLRQSLLDDLARKNRSASERAVAVLKESETATRLARVSPPPFIDFQRVNDLIAANKPIEAMVELEKLARALDAMAAGFDDWSRDRADAKLAAKQMSQWQDDLRIRLAESIKDRGFNGLAQPIQTAFRMEQAALLRTVERLGVPKIPELTTLRTTALTHLGLAVKSLEGDGSGTDKAMRNAVETLARLSEILPPRAERLARTLPELRKIRGEQESIFSAAESILRQYERESPTDAIQQALAKRLQPLLERQKAVAESVKGLDLPGLESRQARCWSALMTTASDLTKGAPYDVAASLYRARSRLDWLEAAADGRVPPDAKAEELTRLQRSVVDGLSGVGTRPGPDRMIVLEGVQKDITRELPLIAASEAAVLLHEARAAAAAVESGFGSRPNLEDLARRSRIAVAALSRLADRLEDREAPRDRVKGLAAMRRGGAETAIKLAGRPFDPNASGEAKRQLAREAEELLHTRVGTAGQAIKKRALEAYARLQAKNEPGRDAAAQKQLTEILDQLVATMKGPGLVTAEKVQRELAGPDPADQFLPSAEKADALRHLARQARELREQANNLEKEIAIRTRPTPDNALALLEQRQRILTGSIDALAQSLLKERESAAAENLHAAAEAARHAADRLKFGQVHAAREAAGISARRLRALSADSSASARKAAELAIRQDSLLGELSGLIESPAAVAAQIKAQHDNLSRMASELARTLDLASDRCLPGEPLGKAIHDAADLVRNVEQRLLDAGRSGVEGKLGDAKQRRSEAARALLQAAATVSAVAGKDPAGEPIPEITTGEEVRRAETAMRRALADLGSGRDPEAVQRSMRQARHALDRAIETIDLRLRPAEETKTAP